MTDILHREFVYIWYYFDIQLRQIFPYWVLGMVLGSAVSVFAKEKIHNAVRSLSGKKLGAFGAVPASMLGIASPLCMYGTIPLAASFSRYGISDDWLAAFMVSSVLLNPQLLIYSAALGTTALAVRTVSCFLCGVTAGLLVRFCCGKNGRQGMFFSGSKLLRNRKAGILTPVLFCVFSRILAGTSGRQDCISCLAWRFRRFSRGMCLQMP